MEPKLYRKPIDLREESMRIKTSDMGTFAREEIIEHSSLSRKAKNVLFRRGIYTWDKLRAVDNATLLNWRGCGQVTFEELVKAKQDNQ